VISISEKKQVLYDLRMSYKGPFSVEDLYKEADDWAKENGFEKEHKRKMEHVTKDGKKIEWLTEIHSHLDDYHHGDVVLRVQMDNVKEITIKKGIKKYKINNGEVYVLVECFISSHLHGTFWQSRPGYRFMRTLIDRFVYNAWSDKYDGVVNTQGRELFKRIQSFFKLQKFKYG
jgi:hypothetical protein